VAGENDIRVAFSQNFVLERGLHYRKVPVELLLLPNGGHPPGNNSWHGKIKARKELKWLQIYGYNSSIGTKN
jgi:dipeptidyl aminopeptidase/acylaminoacyl peptidase